MKGHSDLSSFVFLLLLCFCFASKKEHPVTSLMLRKLGKSGSFNQEQINNARGILEQCVKHTTEVNQLSYILATVIRECGLRPIKEYRGSPDSELWHIQNRYWHTGFYGRGYVQLTWEFNYATFSKILNIDLLRNPDLALDSKISSKILCIGMTKGLFTGVSLSHYFGPGKADWVNARRIVNGLDKAKEFAEHAALIARL